MFSGIIKEIGKIKCIEEKGVDLWIGIQSKLKNLKIDQSVSHNGVCLTVEKTEEDIYYVTAIKETINKTTISHWKEGELLNLELGLKIGNHLDGHIVQGHIDEVGVCEKVYDKKGEKLYTISYSNESKNITVEKGSITINGVSLTIFNVKTYEFQVAIIPYTYENTTFKYIKKKTLVNLEFDIIGKYLQKLNETYNR